MASARLSGALDFVTDPRNIQQLAYGDHKLKLSNGEEIVVGAALLKTCQAQLHRDYLEQCKLAGTVPLSEKLFRDACSASANGQTKSLGAPAC